MSLPEVFMESAENEIARNEERALSILDISWEDILESHLLPYLNCSDLFHLRATSVQCKQLVNDYLRKLRIVDFQQTIKSDDHKATLSIAFQVLTKNCVHIRVLILTQNSWISDSDLTPVFVKNTRLVHVDLRGCIGMSGTSLLSLVMSCQELRVLKLGGCIWVSSEIMKTLATGAHLQNLEEVDLSSCSALTNSDIIPFLQAFPGLRVVELAGIQSVNDGTMVAVARSCARLSKLNIRACVSVTDNGLRNVAEYSKELTSLQIAHCHQITERSLSYLRKRTNLRIDRLVSDAEALPFKSYQVQV